MRPRDNARTILAQLAWQEMVSLAIEPDATACSCLRHSCWLAGIPRQSAKFAAIVYSENNMADVEDLDSASTSQIDLEESVANQHPWPYLAYMFKYVSTSGNTYKFQCLLCLPKHTECSAYRNSPSNIKKHVDRVHPSQIDAYDNLAASAHKRKIDNPGFGGEAKKLKQQRITCHVNNANMVTQAVVDEAVVNLIVGALLPLRIVEIKEFVELITTLQPNLHVMGRKALRGRINDAAKTMKKRVVAVLNDQTHVATTTDCWSSYGKSYIGVTVHWIDNATLERKSAYLALRRMKGRHTYDMIAGALDDIHTEYGIGRKIVRTTTDNGSNFVKAFAVFSHGDENADDDVGSDDEPGDDNDADAATVDVYSTLSEGESQSDGEIVLPRHQRCACHTLNLIATADANTAENDPQYKKSSRSTFGKCHALWNKYGRSVAAVEAVQDVYGLGLKRPNATRWNSMYMATERIVRLLNEKGEDEFRKLCSKLDVARFTTADVQFLATYVAVMKPVAQALDILQSESKMYMAYLLPTITILREKLECRRASSGTCTPLVTALLDGIDRRFGDVFNDKDTIAAAILRPKFRDNWTDDRAVIDSGLSHIRHLLSETSSDVAHTSGATG